MKRRLVELGMLVAVLAAAGGIVLVSGVFPIKASSGHWAVTSWILNFASDRSVAFHSAGIEPPPLDEPQLVRLGAAIFDSNCRWCHGRPGAPMPVMAIEMTPPPPRLAETVARFESRELFYLVKHGIKFTGMPGWPALNRDDEIWPLVAFLPKLSEIDQETYLEHVRPKVPSESELPSLVARRCAGCHGFDGRGRAGRRVPHLAGQAEAYLKSSLQAYKTGDRHSGIMQPIAARMTESEIEQLASYYADIQSEQSDSEPEDSEPEDNKPEKNDRQPTSGSEDPDALVELGRKLVEDGDAKAKIPSCVDCHGPGNQVRRSEYPKLAGQPRWYLQKQLRLFADRSRGGSANATLMHPIADKLSDEQIEAVATFYARQKLEP